MVVVRLRSKPELAELEEQLAAAVAEQDTAARAVEQAEAAKNSVDATDRVAWERVEMDLVAARSEHERCDRAASVAYRRCADAAEEIASAKEAKVVAELAAVTSRIAELERELREARGEENVVQDRLEDAIAATSESRVRFLAPGSPEREAYEGRQRQRDERLHWHARHPEADDRLGRRDRTEAFKIRAEGIAAAKAANEASLALARERGELLEPDGTPTGREFERV